jgi:hypothetical protein
MGSICRVDGVVTWWVSLPSERRRPRVYRTRIDPFADVWDDVQEVLEAEPRLRAKTLFEDLQRKFPGRFPNTTRFFDFHGGAWYLEWIIFEKLNNELHYATKAT